MSGTPFGYAGSNGRVLAVMEFGDIELPGAYVTKRSGHLFRVPAESLRAGRSPVITITSCQPVLVARISDDPLLPLNEARCIAADHDLPVNF